MNQIHFDTVLKKALAEVVREEYAEVTGNAEQQNISFSRKYLEHRERMLKNPAVSYQKQTGSVKVINAVALVALLLLMGMAAGATLLP